jgi:hypothetical protein
VQLLPEHTVQPGQVAALIASHDTYAISFTLDDTAAEGNTSAAGAAAAALQPQPTGVPLFDPLWRAAYEQLTGLQVRMTGWQRLMWPFNAVGDPLYVHNHYWQVFAGIMHTTL